MKRVVGDTVWRKRTASLATALVLCVALTEASFAFGFETDPASGDLAGGGGLIAA